MGKDTSEQQLNMVFRGKASASRELVDSLWEEFFEVLNLFSEEE